MISVSDPLSPAQMKAYYVEEFAQGQGQYYTEGDRVEGTWCGKLAEEWGLIGASSRHAFNRLADGQHPLTGQQLIAIQTPRLRTNRKGKQKTTMEHRAGWDLVLAPDKSVSVTALVAGHEAIRRAHEESVTRTMTVVIEPWLQARMGGNAPAETTARGVAVMFQHDSARPVDGYSAPHLHTHVVLFNMTRTEDGDVWPLQPRQMFRTQELAKRFYQSEMAMRLIDLGYQIERGEFDQAVIVGYTPEYLQAASPRREEIKKKLIEMKRSGAAAAQIAAHQTREAKQFLTPAEVLGAHREMAKTFGNQPQDVTRVAQAREQPVALSPHRTSAEDAVTFAKDSVMERQAVADERTLLARAYLRTLGERRTDEIIAEFDRRVETPEFIAVPQQAGVPGRHFTTPEMKQLERDNIRRMLEGTGGDQRELANASIRRDVERHYHTLTVGQQAAVKQLLSGRHQFQALDGPAGAGKTLTLAAIRDAAVADGYQVVGFAPTSGAALLMQDSGIDAMTLQRFIAKHDGVNPQRHLYVLDESSLASTQQVHDLMERLSPRDRVLLVGDVRQHEAVDAGRPYQQLQDAGLSTAHLTEILRQTNPEVKAVVELFAKGQIENAMEKLDAMGMVHEIEDRDDRFQAIANDYAQSPRTTLVISPNNEGRVALNHVIHRTLQARGEVDAREHTLKVLVTRNDMTKADRKVAGRYHVGDWVRFTQESPSRGIAAGEYARVTAVRAGANRLRVTRGRGSLTYDPKRLYGVTVYEEVERQFSVGDRVQFTAPERFTVDGTIITIANRARGMIAKIGRGGQVHLVMDSGTQVVFDGHRKKHLDHGYAVTSHSSQGLTEDRTIVDIDTDHAGELLVNRRTAYVGGSRSRAYLAFYTNDAERLSRVLDRDVSKQAALSREEVRLLARQQTPAVQAHGQSHAI